LGKPSRPKFSLVPAAPGGSRIPTGRHPILLERDQVRSRGIKSRSVLDRERAANHVYKRIRLSGGNCAGLRN
jgi:hypothetical protein